MNSFDYDQFGGGVEMFGNGLSIWSGAKGSLKWIPNREIYGVIYKTELPPHGSPQDRGSADRYYGRLYSPHFWPLGTEKGDMIEKASMTQAEIAAYKYGWDNEKDRKDWG